MSSANPPTKLRLPHIHALAEVAKFVSHDRDRPEMLELRLKADGTQRQVEASNGKIIAIYRWDADENVSIDTCIPPDLILNSAQKIQKKTNPSEVLLTREGCVWYASGTGIEGEFKLRKLSDALWNNRKFPRLSQQYRDSIQKHSSQKTARLYQDRLRRLCKSVNEIRTARNSWSQSERRDFMGVMLNSVNGRMSFMFKRDPYLPWAEAALTKRVPCIATGQRAHVGVHPFEFEKILSAFERINEGGAVLKFPDEEFKNILMESGSGRVVFLWMPEYVPSLMGNRASGIYDRIYARERQRVVDEVNTL